MTITPVSVFTYNRPTHTQWILESLAVCHRLDECQVFLFSDGAKTPDQEQAVRATRAVLHEWKDRLRAQVIEQTVNLGLARSIVGGVTELCETYGRVIVVEDDLVLHPAFIDYMLSALDRYENEEKVAQISGYMFPVKNPKKPDVLFLPLTTTWGWATWLRAWKDVDWQAINVINELQDQNLRKRFDLDGAFPYTQMLLDRLNQINQSWGVLFRWHTFRKGDLTLYPRRTLVFNSGMDGSGYHTHSPVLGFNPHRMTLSKDFFSVNEIQWPSHLVIDLIAYQRIRQYLKGLSKPNLKKRLLRRFLQLKQHLKRRSL
jgi:hypothetical protein